MKLSYLTVGSRDINEEELRILYNDFNEIFNDKNNNFNVNVTNYERFIVDGSDKITLNNTFKTIRGDEPTIVYTDIKYCNSLERYFKYSTELNKYCYVPTKYKNSYLQYDIKYNSYPFLFVKGLFKPFSKENGEYYTLFTITSKQTNEELLKVSYKHPLFYVYRKGLERQDSSENVVALSYDRFNKIMIHNMDDELYLKINNHQIEFDSTLINENVNIIIGNDSDNNAFSGLISDLEFGYSELNDIDFKTSFINKFDSQGRLRNKIIKLNNNEEIKTIYSYYDEVNEDNTKTLNSLCSRIKNYDGTEEIIEYNDNNSIIKRVIISNNKIIKIINYVYDDFNRLIEQVEYYVNDNDTLLEKYKYIYEYDTFGNIIKSKEYFESNLIKDLKYIYTLDYTNRLIKVIDDTNDSITNIEYNNSLYPNNINNNVLEYQGNRLIRYNDVSYEYDTLGKRTKKIKSNNNENYIVNYYYENDNLVRQVKGNIIIDYIYNNNIVEGLVYNNTEYYFVRDITGCIEKIIDKNKKTMVLYRYSSYGEVYSTLGDSLTSSEETIAETLRNNNGFVYKGYYYDVETQLFYCNSRYYSPELCRWISPDDIEYLDPESVNGLNLYCYCLNNPISYFDPTGHSWESFWRGVGIGAIVGVGVGQASNTSDKLGITGWKKFWYSVSGIFVGDFLVSLENWCTIRKTIMMDSKNNYNFKFDQNPFYSLWNAPLYAIYLKNNQYKDEDSRTTLGLYLELQAHYLFYLIGNDHALDGAYMGPTDVDSTGKLFELLASAFRNTTKGIPPKMWWPNI